MKILLMLRLPGGLALIINRSTGVMIITLGKSSSTNCQRKQELLDAYEGIIASRSGGLERKQIAAMVHPEQ